MKTVYKYPVEIGDRLNAIDMPADAQVVRFAVQSITGPCIWALVDPENGPIRRKFRVFGTGHPVPEGFDYVGSCDDGPYVWHLFETDR